MKRFIYNSGRKVFVYNGEFKEEDHPRGEEGKFGKGGKGKETEVRDVKNEYNEVISKYKGTTQWMKTPTGEETELTEKQWVQTRTDSFKDWFGDFEKEKDKYNLSVGEEGEPRKFYHDSRNGAFSGIEEGGGEFGGIFVLPDHRAGYSKKEHSYELFVREPIATLEDLRDSIEGLKNSGAKTYSDILKTKVSENQAEELTDALTDGSDYPTDEELWDLIGAYDESSATIKIQKLRGLIAKSVGFGAVVTPDEFGQETLMVVNPTSIKSATDNSGEFNTENKNITNTAPRRFIYKANP